MPTKYSQMVDEWTQVYRGSASVLSGQRRLVGRADLAQAHAPHI